MCVEVVNQRGRTERQRAERGRAMQKRRYQGCMLHKNYQVVDLQTPGPTNHGQAIFVARKQSGSNGGSFVACSRPTHLQQVPTSALNVQREGTISKSTMMRIAYRTCFFWRLFAAQRRLPHLLERGQGVPRQAGQGASYPRKTVLWERSRQGLAKMMPVSIGPVPCRLVSMASRPMSADC